MKEQRLQEHDIVSITKDFPEYNLVKGEIGSIVDYYNDVEVEVEFSGVEDADGDPLVVYLKTRYLKLIHQWEYTRRDRL